MQRPGRAPTSQGLQGCCSCSSLWRALPPLEINDSLGSTWGLAAKTNTQTARLGLSVQRSGCKILVDPSLQHAWSPSASVLCRWTGVFLVSMFPMAQRRAPLPQPQSHPQHVCPAVSPVQPPWVTWMCGLLGAVLLSTGIAPWGFVWQHGCRRVIFSLV